MKNLLILCGASFLSACAISDLSNMATMDGMKKTWQGAQELNKNLETYKKVNDTVNTVKKTSKIIDAVSNAAEE